MAFPSLVGPSGPPGGAGAFFENYDALRAINASAFTGGYIAWVSGYATSNDGGGGNFAYAPASAVADNDGTVLAPANAIGRWIRVTAYPINVAWFGANPTASAAANTLSFNAAINAAALAYAGTYASRVEIPVGSYSHDGITISPASGRLSINFVGIPGAAGVRLSYTGAGGVGLTIEDNVYFTVENMEISDGGTGATGVRLRGIAPGIASAGNAIFKNVLITGFTTGLHIGTTTDQAADVLKFLNFQVSGSTTGILIEGANGITLAFENLGGSNNATFLRFVGDADNNTNCLRIVGGGVSGSTTELRIEAPLNLSVANWYTEGAVVNYRFLDCPTPTYAGDRFPLQVRVSNCVLNQTNIVASRLYIPGSYTFENVGHFAAYDIGSTTAADRFNLRVAQGTGGAATPVTYAGGGAGSLVNVRREQVGGSPNNNQVAYKDEFYVLRSGGSKQTIWEYLWDTATPPDSLENLRVKNLYVNGQTAIQYDSAGFANYKWLQATAGAAFRWALNNDGTFNLQHSTDDFATVNVRPLSVTAADKLLVGIASLGPIAIGAIRFGTAVLVAGTVNVVDGNVTANTRIFVTSNVDGGAPGWLRVASRAVGASFAIASSSGTDTSTVAWLAIEP